MQTVRDIIFLGFRITADHDCSREIKRRLLLGGKVMTLEIKRRLLLGGKVMTQCIKKQGHYFATKVHLVKAVVFSSTHVWMWELEHKECWVLKNWCFWSVVLEKTLENPLGCKEIKPVSPKGNQSSIFSRRTNAEAEAPRLWLPDVKSQLIRKDPDDGKIEGRGRRGWQRRDGWMASLTHWTWVWVSSGRW